MKTFDTNEPTPVPAEPLAPASGPEPSLVRVAIETVDGQGRRAGDDALAVEEPLEIRLVLHQGAKKLQRSISITMRTPGQDAELTCGFLLSEGILRSPDDVAGVRPCGPPTGDLQLRNVVRVELRPHVEVDLGRLERHFYTSSSCGVCGKSSIAALEVADLRALPAEVPVISSEVVHDLPGTLRRAQQLFEVTGGLHASALFDTQGQLLAVREDVGRHNALDKLIGAEFLAGRLPLAQRILLVSGRASFELVQKALVAGIPIMAAVGAPSSLAAELANRYDMTLLGFVRSGRFNVYSGSRRIAGGNQPTPTHSSSQI